MKAAIASLTGLLALAGCPVGTPSTAVVDKIELRTGASKCVGPLNNWWRHYAFQHRGDRIDTGIVSLHYVEAGHNGLPAGRFITEPEPPSVDDSQHRLVYAEYDISSGKFLEWACGWNFPPRR